VGGGGVDVQVGGAVVLEAVADAAVGGAGVQAGRDSGGGAHRDRAGLGGQQGVAVLGPDTPAGARLENVARFLDFVSESLTRAAEQAREVLYTKPETREPNDQ
jgi:hypothetical protein